MILDKKKILIIPSWYPEINNPNQGVFVRNQAELLSDEFDIRVMAGRLINSSKRIKKLIISFKYFINKSVALVKGNNIFVSPPYVFEFEYSKGANIFVERNFQIKIDSYVRYFEDDILPNWKPDLIHAHNTNFAGIVAAEISKKHSIPYIITDHHHMSSSLPYHTKSLVTEALKLSKENCFVSDWQYRTYLLADNRIGGRIIGNPIDTEFLKPSEIQPEKFVISHLSNADTSKDIDTLFKAINHFFNRINDYSNIEVKIAGFPKNVIKDCQSNYGDNKWFTCIIFLLPLDKNEVLKLLHESSVYLHTSIYESFGLSPLEAISCGIPVVSTDNGGINEYINDGENGILCKVKDYKALGDAVHNIYTGNLTFEKEKITKSIEGKFDNSQFVSSMTEIYNNSLC